MLYIIYYYIIIININALINALMARNLDALLRDY